MYYSTTPCGRQTPLCTDPNTLQGETIGRAKKEDEIYYKTTPVDDKRGTVAVVKTMADQGVAKVQRCAAGPRESRAVEQLSSGEER